MRKKQKNHSASGLDSIEHTWEIWSVTASGPWKAILYSLCELTHLLLKKIDRGEK